MNITKNYLKKIIKEEMQHISENPNMALKADLGEIEDDIKNYLIDEAQFEQVKNAFNIILTSVKLSDDNATTLELLLDLFKEYREIQGSLNIK
jgi:hypothetical protein